MKFSTIATLVTATAGFAAAQPHKHHAHHHKRAGENVVNVYVLNGRPITEAEVQQGIANGTLVLESGSGQLASAAAPIASPAAAAVEKAAPAKSSPSLTVTVDTESTKAKIPKIPQSTSAPSDDDNENTLPADAPVSDSASSFSTSGTGLNTPFPDGEIDCDTFPSKYGPIAVPWMGYGGYTGIQSPESTAAGFANIVTKVTSMCSGASCCSEGDYCSYACPPGYQKTQWPETQGATGQSIGGLLCKNGKLHLTNTELSKSLCMKGASQVNVQVKNTMSEVASVCRTDYPGTEGEVIPLSATAGSSTPLTCPEGDKYYMWDGKITSAQYYVNPKGVPVQDACQWGSSDKPWGNFAPMNLGVGYSAGAAWLSIFQNLPTTNEKLDYTVELVGDNGGFDNFVGKCKYTKGQYCSGDNYENCSSDGKGCTVNVKSGTATFVFSD